jgi:hypothetical protein
MSLQLPPQATHGRYLLAEDPRLEAGGRARCAFSGLNPDEPAPDKGSLIPLWRPFVSEVRAVLEAADAADQATPAMQRAGVAALSRVRPTLVAWLTKFGSQCRP